MHFALTGQHVFQGRTLVEVCSHHLHTTPEPPSKRLDSPVPADLEALVLECLEKDPARRPAGRPGAAPPAVRLRGVRRLERRGRPRVVGAERRGHRPTVSPVPEDDLTLSRRLSPVDGQAS